MNAEMPPFKNEKHNFESVSIIDLQQENTIWKYYKINITHNEIIWEVKISLLQPQSTK